MTGKECPARAFTLVELLVVMVIIGLLVAMLVPSVSAVWQSALASKCRQNLERLWGAYSVWRADNGLAVMSDGPGWRAAVAPYLEGRDEILRCPAVNRADRGESGGGGSPVADAPTLADISFRMYRNLNGYDSLPPRNQPRIRGEHLGTAVVEDCPGVEIKSLGGGKYYIGIEDAWFMGSSSGFSGSHCDDMRFYVWLNNGALEGLEVIGGDEISGGSGNSWILFIFDMYIGSKLVVEDWTLHYGNEISGITGTTFLDLSLYSKSGDYGISKGSYAVEGAVVPALDPRRFLILDYPKAVADYNGDGLDGGEDLWDKFFILDGEAWMANYSEDLWGSETWEAYQSLRHFGEANMLFCDGHVETLPPEDLHETNPLWRWNL